MNPLFARWLLAAGLVFSSLNPTAQSLGSTKPQAAIFQDKNLFPIAVWLQHPRNAERYKAAGINAYVGLWNGPTEDQLVALEKAGMPVICGQTRFALTNKHNGIIAGWMHDDEPDNAQSLGPGKGYGPPILPSVIQGDYEKMRVADPTRPVLLNLGQGVAYDNYIGRGVRRNRPEDYPEYIKGADIVSFDIYPVVHEKPEIAGNLEYVARGVKRLVEWGGGQKTVWNCIECTHISNPERKATPEQIRAEVWMSLIHGSRGLIYFVHQFKPQFKEAALLDDLVTLDAVTKINNQIKELAPILNQPPDALEVRMKSGSGGSQIAWMSRAWKGAVYLFAVSMENRGGEASFEGAAFPRAGKAEVLGEARNIRLEAGSLSDAFKPYEVHLYKIALE